MISKQELLNKEFLKLMLLCFMIGSLSCDSEDAWDCIQTEGTQVERSFDLQSFNSLLVNRNIEVVIKQEDKHQLRIVTGGNLLSDIDFKVEDDQLVLTDYNNCNLVRNYGTTKIYVSAPNLRVIRSSTQYEISSEGQLNYPELTLVSEDFNDDSLLNVGDFRININSETLDVISNNSSFFYISGTTQNLYVGFFSGVGRFEGKNLDAANVEVFHRGSNDIFVNPQDSLTGELRGTGNLISYNKPELVDVERFYQGRLIFSD